MIRLSTLVLFMFTIVACNHNSSLAVNITPDRPCQIDNTGQAHIKSWGTCPNASSSCLLRWRIAGSTNPWSNNGTNARIRSETRNPPDSELEYNGFCK